MATHPEELRSTTQPSLASSPSASAIGNAQSPTTHAPPPIADTSSISATQSGSIVPSTTESSQGPFAQISKTPDEPDDSSPSAGDAKPAGTQQLVLENKAPLDQIDLFLNQWGQLVTDQYKNAFVVVTGNGNPRLLKIGSDAMHGLIAKFLKKLGRRATKRLLQEFCDQLRADAALLDATTMVFSRVAQKADGTVVIALHDQQNTHIHIKPGSVQVLTEGSDIYFYKAPTALPMAMPAEVGNWKRLKKYVNLNDKSFLLLVAWLSYTLAHAKVAGNVFVILLLIGGMGTGKSWICKLIIRLIDPSSIGIQRIPKKEQDLAIGLQGCQVAAYDNLGWLSQDMSDSFCTAATGGSVTARKLYTNDDVHVIKHHGAAVLNSIGDVATQPDFLQRSLSLRPSPMNANSVAGEDDLLKEFEADLPVIQRGLFDLIAQVLTHLPDAKVARPQRMFAFVRWLSAMELAHGIPIPVYQDAYAESINDSQLEGLRDNVLSSAVLDFADSLTDGKWSGTPADLLAELNAARGYVIRRAPQGWPDNEIALSKRLLPLQAALMTQGIDVQSTRGKERHITIRRIEVQ